MSEPDAPLAEAMIALKERKSHEAEALAREVLRKTPTSAQAMFVLGCAISDYGDDAEALRLLQQAMAVDPLYTAPYGALSKAYYSSGRLADAADLYRKWSHVEPENPEVLHMTAAMTGEQVSAKCSEEYVRGHFNEFSRNFDDVLLHRLAYRGPEVIASLMARYNTNSDRRAVLDAGCGTGLCGPAIRSFCYRLIGVDLAEKMLERARARDCYDDLFVSEICAFMNSHEEGFDAIVSSDVLIYFGALDGVMKSACHALKSRGLLIFALEALENTSADSYRLTPSGRYAHAAAYLHEVATASGLHILAIEQEHLRWERGQKVPFHCVVAQRKA